MEIIEIDENLFKLIELMLKFSKMVHGDFFEGSLELGSATKPSAESFAGGSNGTSRGSCTFTTSTCGC